ncbi:MAG: GNAT family N-acetyltransferase [Armatimonadota bacterium]
MSNDDMRATLTLRDGETLVARRLRAGDGPKLQAFNAALSPQSRGFFLPHAYDDATVARMIERAERGMDLTYVVLSGEEVVGYFFLWEFRDPIPILGIGMADVVQGRGLGQQLMQILIDDARRADRDGIDLTTMQHNDRAFALYQKMGFRYIENVDNYDGDGRLIVERWMFLPLKPDAQPVKREHKPPA